MAGAGVRDAAASAEGWQYTNEGSSPDRPKWGWVAHKPGVLQLLEVGAGMSWCAELWGGWFTTCEPLYQSCWCLLQCVFFCLVLLVQKVGYESSPHGHACTWAGHADVCTGHG